MYKVTFSGTCLPVVAVVLGIVTSTSAALSLTWKAGMEGLLCLGPGLLQGLECHDMKKVINSGEKST